MFGQSKIARWRCTRRAIGAAVLMLVLVVSMTLMTGTSQACPPGATAATKSTTHKAASKTVITPKVIVTATVSTPRTASLRGIGSCCGGASHSSNSGCSHACCASGTGSILDTTSNVAFEKTASAYVLAQRDKVTLASPDPNYRPPRWA
jgi:hypothetical protein